MAHDRRQHRGVRPRGRNAHALALELARAPDRPAGDDRGERPLHDRHDPDDVAAALAGPGEVVDVEDRELRTGADEALQRGRPDTRGLQAQLDPLGAVEVAHERELEPRVDGGGRSVEGDRGARVRAVLLGAAAPGGDQGGDEGEDGGGPRAAAHRRASMPARAVAGRTRGFVSGPRTPLAGRPAEAPM